MKYGIDGNCPTDVVLASTVAATGRTTAAASPVILRAPNRRRPSVGRGGYWRRDLSIGVPAESVPARVESGKSILRAEGLPVGSAHGREEVLHDPRALRGEDRL